MKADTRTTREVLKALKDWTQAYQAHDLCLAMSHIVPETTAVFIGTGADEERLNRAGIRRGFERDFTQTARVRISYTGLKISARGPVAWLHGRAIFHAVSEGRRVKLTGRLTMVLEKRGKRWLIAQGHLSEPTGSQRRGHSF